MLAGQDALDDRLARMISDYLDRVADAVAVLERAGYRRPQTDMDWTVMDGPPHGELVPGYRFYKHGIGCAVKGPGWAVDFDFGEQGQIDGIDPWRLKQFAEPRLASYGIRSTEEIDTLFSAACAAGELVFSGYILFYVRRVAG